MYKLLLIFILNLITSAFANIHLKEARVIAQEEGKTKIINEGMLYIIDNKYLTIDKDLCNEAINIPLIAISLSKPASKRQLSFTCKPSLKTKN